MQFDAPIGHQQYKCGAGSASRCRQRCCIVFYKNETFDVIAIIHSSAIGRGQELERQQFNILRISVFCVEFARI